MPNRHATKKGRLSGEARKAINAKTVEDAIGSEDVLFGRVSKHLGMGRVEVLVDDHLGSRRPVQAHIRKVLCRRGSTPITTSDIVGLTPRDYESSAGTLEAKYDLICILDRKSVSRLEKEGRIQKWMLATTVDSIEGAKITEDGFEFDYTANAADGGKFESSDEDDSDDDDDDVDIDKI
jgi:hypothetical protein